MSLTASRLLLTGAMVKERYKIFFSDVPLLLTGKSFKYLFKLAVEKHIGGEGWVHKEELEPGINQARYIHNLKKEVSTSSIDSTKLIENDHKGNYRLRLNSDEIDIDMRMLLHSEDFEIAELSRKLTVFYRNKGTEDEDNETEQQDALAYCKCVDDDSNRDDISN